MPVMLMKVFHLPYIYIDDAFLHQHRMQKKYVIFVDLLILMTPGVPACSSALAVHRNFNVQLSPEIGSALTSNLLARVSPA